MTQRCPDCNGPVKAGYVLPDEAHVDFVRASRASPGTAEIAKRKTKRCLGCGLEPVGRDSMGTPP